MGLAKVCVYAVFAIVQSYETGPSTEKRFEAHRRHVDIQFVVAGRERILCIPMQELEVEAPYDDERDVEFYHDPPASSSVLLMPGDFAIFHPHDGHKPGCMAGGRAAVRKAVEKAGYKVRELVLEPLPPWQEAWRELSSKAATRDRAEEAFAGRPGVVPQLGRVWTEPSDPGEGPWVLKRPAAPCRP